MKIFLDANICLDLLDTTRVTSKKSVEWYLANKDKQEYEFFFSADFITTFFYILTQKRKLGAKETLYAIDALSSEILPHYLIHNDFQIAKLEFFDGLLEDFEDLLVVSSASRINCAKFITNDKELLKLKKYEKMEIVCL
jgi:predicted nucleic acid-binding protein